MFREDGIKSSILGEKRLGDAEGSTVVVAVKEPRRDLVTACGTHRVLYGIVDIHTLHLDNILPVLCRFDCVRGAPNTVNS